MAVFGIGATVKQVVSEDNGNGAFIRVITGIIILVVLGNWTWYNVTHGTLSGFDLNDLFVILGPLGIKAFQKGREK